MRIMRIVLVLALTAMLPAAPSVASPECELFLISGPYVGYHDDPAFYGCAPVVPGGPHDTSVLMPGALGAFGFVHGDASARPPTHASITVTDVDGRESRTSVTFRWKEYTQGYGGYWLTAEYVDLGPRAMGVVILARFSGRMHRHEYGRLLPPKNGPARSGRIAAGVAPGILEPVLGAYPCEASPECRAWLASGCVPRLGGRDPAVTSSIVDVRGLAGSTRHVVLEWPYGAGLDSAWEFWTSDCRRIGDPRTSGSLRGSITIPRTAHWMTVTAPIGPYTWELW